MSWTREYPIINTLLSTGSKAGGQDKDISLFGSEGCYQASNGSNKTMRRAVEKKCFMIFFCSFTLQYDFIKRILKYYLLHILYVLNSIKTFFIQLI